MDAITTAAREMCGRRTSMGAPTQLELYVWALAPGVVEQNRIPEVANVRCPLQGFSIRLDVAVALVASKSTSSGNYAFPPRRSVHSQPMSGSPTTNITAAAATTTTLCACLRNLQRRYLTPTGSTGAKLFNSMERVIERLKRTRDTVSRNFVKMRQSFANSCIVSIFERAQKVVMRTWLCIRRATRSDQRRVPSLGRWAGR